MTTYTTTYSSGQNPAVDLEEHMLYGSSRLGLESVGQAMAYIEVVSPTTPTITNYYQGNVTGDKRFELSNHLGNVLQVVTDHKLLVDDTDNHIGYFLADVVSYSDYYPYGMVLPGDRLLQGRLHNDAPDNYEAANGSAQSYRYGFQGQEKDDEIKGQPGNSINYKYRMHDPRIGRFFAVDPLAPKYPHNSPYAFSENRVIDAVELEGLEQVSVHDSGINPEEHISGQDENGNNLYTFTLGDKSFENVSMVTDEHSGKSYFDIGQHMYYGDNGWSEEGSNDQKITEYSHIQLFDVNRPQDFVKWQDSRLPKDQRDNCAWHAVLQALILGVELQGGGVNTNTRIVVFDGDGYKPGDPIISDDATQLGIDYINEQLEMGNAVVFGVWEGGSGTDKLGTIHYSVITGRVTSKGVDYFLYVDGQTIHGERKGYNFDRNRLEFEPGGIYKKQTVNTGFRTKEYIHSRVTRIQLNKE